MTNGIDHSTVSYYHHKCTDHICFKIISPLSRFTPFHFNSPDLHILQSKIYFLSSIYFALNFLLIYNPTSIAHSITSHHTTTKKLLHTFFPHSIHCFIFSHFLIQFHLLQLCYKIIVLFFIHLHFHFPCSTSTTHGIIS